LKRGVERGLETRDSVDTVHRPGSNPIATRNLGKEERHRLGVPTRGRTRCQGKKKRQKRRDDVFEGTGSNVARPLKRGEGEGGRSSPST